MTALGMQVTAGLMRLRMIERALHDKDGWGIACSGLSAPAVVEEIDYGIRFTAVLPGLCSLGEDDPIIDITKDGDAVWSVRLDGSLGENGTEVVYEASLGVSVGE